MLFCFSHSSSAYPATHHPHRAFGTVNTSDTSPARTPAEFARLAHHGVATAFSVSRNSLVRFSSLPINSDYLALIRGNTTTQWGSPDCYSHL
ncbi:hypothetical protein QT996_13235 [Microcoleus sp. S13C4]